MPTRRLTSDELQVHLLLVFKRHSDCQGDPLWFDDVRGGLPTQRL